MNPSSTACLVWMVFRFLFRSHYARRRRDTPPPQHKKKNLRNSLNFPVCRWLDLYGEERGRRYADMVRGDRSGLPPHVYSTRRVSLRDPVFSLLPAREISLVLRFVCLSVLVAKEMLACPRVPKLQTRDDPRSEQRYPLEILTSRPPFWRCPSTSKTTTNSARSGAYVFF